MLLFWETVIMLLFWETVLTSLILSYCSALHVAEEQTLSRVVNETYVLRQWATDRNA